MIRCILCHGTLNVTYTGYSCSSRQKQYHTQNGIIRFIGEKTDKEYHFPTGFLTFSTIQKKRVSGFRDGTSSSVKFSRHTSQRINDFSKSVAVQALSRAI
jgi:hypothetical protein